MDNITTIVPNAEHMEMPVSIENLVRQLGISGKYTGLNYLVYAVKLVLEHPEKLQLITKNLYPEIADHFGCHVPNIERAIRTVSQVAWHRNPLLLREMAGFRLLDRPTCTELIDFIVNYIHNNNLQIA